MPVVGAPRSFENKFTFTIEIDGVTHAGFNKCSAIEVEVDKVEYREGGSLIPSKTPGLVNFTDITLERGAVSDDSDLYDWFTDVVDAAADSGLQDDAYKRNLTLVVRDRDGQVLKRWRIVNAWPTKFTGGEWDNSTSEKTVEMVTLTYDSFRRIGPTP